MKNVPDRLDKYDTKIYAAGKKKIRNSLEIGEKVLVIAKGIKKISTWKFYKQAVQNILYFNKKIGFTIGRKQNRQKTFYWLKNEQKPIFTKKIPKN